MNQNNLPDENIEIVCQMALTEHQVKQALLNSASGEERLVKLLEGKDCQLYVTWHVFKWDNPEAFCTLTFGVEKEQPQVSPSEG